MSVNVIATGICRRPGRQPGLARTAYDKIQKHAFINLFDSVVAAFLSTSMFVSWRVPAGFARGMNRLPKAIVLTYEGRLSLTLDGCSFALKII